MSVVALNFNELKLATWSWSIAIRATILQNELKNRLPPEFVADFSPGDDITYVSIPLIVSLPEPLWIEVRAAFAESLRVLWKVLVALCAARFFTVLTQREIPLNNHTDRKWGLKEADTIAGGDIADGEKQQGDTPKGNGTAVREPGAI